MRFTAAFNDKPGSCSRASTTSRCARSRNSSGYFLGAGICPPSRGFRASSKPGAVHHEPAVGKTRVIATAIFRDSTSGGQTPNVDVSLWTYQR
jgi:hypothetical protein